ncbi:hypothetical protein N9V92_00880 [Luminiphilus sp.]|nr:hypothetical protein [Luminiphilus sp.]
MHTAGNAFATGHPKVMHPRPLVAVGISKKQRIPAIKPTRNVGSDYEFPSLRLSFHDKTIDLQQTVMTTL